MRWLMRTLPKVITALLFFRGFQCASGNTEVAKCPPEQRLKPNCWCLDSYYGGALFCENLFNPMELAPPVEACRDYNVTAIGIFNSSLTYIPHDIFKGTKFVKVTLMNTQLMSLSNSPLAFEGLEGTLEEIRAIATQYATQWHFHQLRRLKELTLIDINSILMESITEELPKLPKLSAFGLTRAGISYMDDTVFASLLKLRILDLQQNYITEMKRSMLPSPAEALWVLNLQDNKLETLPPDFFEGMPMLQEVLLAKNRFTYLDQKVFSPVLNKIWTLDLAGNPLRCDCRMLWIVNQKVPFHFDAECQMPDSLKGTKIKYLDRKHLWCLVS